MTTRVLPVEEWARLRGTEADAIWPLVDPSTTTVMVVEQDGELVASWLVMRVLHVECLWIAPPYRKRIGVGRRVLRGIRDAVREMGARAFVAGTASDAMRRMVNRLGGVPLESYVVSVPERTLVCRE